MKISVNTCLLLIFSLQLVITSTLSLQNNHLSSSTHTNLAPTTVPDIDPEEDNNKARVDDQVKNMIVISKKSQGGKSGSGGGNNVVHGDKKNDAPSTLPQTLSFYISLCFTFALLLVSF